MTGNYYFKGFIYNAIVNINIEEIRNKCLAVIIYRFCIGVMICTKLP